MTLFNTSQIVAKFAGRKRGKFWVEETKEEKEQEQEEERKRKRKEEK